MPKPRFVAESVEQLVNLARRADPPVQTGELAEIAGRNRRVRLQCESVKPLVVWEQVR